VVIERDLYGPGLPAVPTVSSEDQGQGRAIQRLFEGQLPRPTEGDAQSGRTHA
jgi:hypothetical protein